jgi:Fe-S-cluster containining protein
LNELFERYGDLLREVDTWFASCLHGHADLISCHRGCSACCRGLFDITLLDALYLRSGFDRLADSLQHEIRQKAMFRLNAITNNWPEFSAPWLLNPIPESEWDDIMPEDDETPCVLLSKEGTCLVYDYRPMTCRLNGIPLIDTSGEELFDEWCTLNFIDQDPRLLLGVRYPFRELFAQELLLFRELTERLLGKNCNEIDTLIPAAVCMDAEMVIRLLKHEKTG